MRMVVVLDGELLVPQNGDSGLSGQKQEVARVIEALSILLRGQHELVIVHGNAPQVGFVLLRSEIASQIVHPIPLDVCGSDTQGATGYLLQQALRNCLQGLGIEREVVTLITQVLVDPGDPGFVQPTRGIGPYYDPDKARQYASMRDWQFVLVPGRGYRRAVPSLSPRHIIETRSIKNLLASGVIVICAGGGGVPVTRDGQGRLQGVEAVIDKAATSQLLAREIGADGIIFISPFTSMEVFLEGRDCRTPIQVTLPELDLYLANLPQIEVDLKNKLEASRTFLSSGEGWVLVSSLCSLGTQPGESGGLWITRENVTL